MMGKARVEVYEDTAGEYRWSLLAANNAIVADSAEGYTTRHGAKRAAQRLLQIVSGRVTVEHVYV